MSDDALRKLEREVAAGPPSVRIRLAAELERSGRTDDAVTVLLAASGDRAVRRALGRFRGPAPNDWSAPQGDARNTRRSPARGPRGEGKVLERRPLAPEGHTFFGRSQDQRVLSPEPVPPPLLTGPYVYYSLATGRRVLAATADGHVIAENLGAGGLEWSANRDGRVAWRILMTVAHPDEANPRWWSRPHAAIAEDATVYGVTSFRKLIAVEPNGDRRFDHDLHARVEALALDEARGRFYLLFDDPVMLSTRDLATGKEMFAATLAQLPAAHEAIVCDDGRVACVSAFARVAIVGVSGEVERQISFAERVGGAHGALTPSGELVVVSSDETGAGVSHFDPASGANRGFFFARDCRGAPAVDKDGTIYLDGGGRYVMGFAIAGGAQVYKVERPTLWIAPEQPKSEFALREGEVDFIEVTKDGVTLIRVG